MLFMHKKVTLYPKFFLANLQKVDTAELHQLNASIILIAWVFNKSHNFDRNLKNFRVHAVMIQLRFTEYTIKKKNSFSRFSLRFR